MKKSVFLGEILLRLDTPGQECFVQANNFRARYTGAEANAAVSLVNYGGEAWAVSAVPDHELGQAAVNFLRQYGVYTTHILRKPGRLGVFYLETGASQRPSRVIYDRAGSVMAGAGPEDFDFDAIFADKDHLHFSGTLPALGVHSAALAEAALQAAKKHGLTVSCDLNYRRKLWTPEQAQAVMTRLMKYVDLLIGNEEDAALALGMAPENVDVTRDYDLVPYRELCRRLAERFGFRKVAMTFRKNLSASVNKWSAGLYDGQTFTVSREYTMNVIDRVGGGDSFTGALLYAEQEGMAPREAIEFAVAASCLKHSIPGDFNLVGKQEVFHLMAGDGSGRVQR